MIGAARWHTVLSANIVFYLHGWFFRRGSISTAGGLGSVVALDSIIHCTRVTHFMGHRYENRFLDIFRIEL